jgi:TolA-binding protein
MKRIARALVVTLGIGCVTPLTATASDYLLFSPGPAAGEPTPPTPGVGVLVKKLTIKKGDTLSRLSRKNTGKSSYYPQILLFNNIANPNLIYTGDTILVPVAAAKDRSRKKASLVPTRTQPAAKEAEAAATPAPVVPAKRKGTSLTKKAEAPAASASVPAATAEQSLYAKAVGEYKTGQYEQAMQSFGQFIEQFPASPLLPDASLYKAECLLNLSNEQ